MYLDTLSESCFFFIISSIFSMFPLYYCFAPLAGYYSNPFHNVAILKSVCFYMFYIVFLSHNFWFSRILSTTGFSFCMHVFSPVVIQGLSLLCSLTVTFFTGQVAMYNFTQFLS